MVVEWLRVNMEINCLKKWYSYSAFCIYPLPTSAEEIVYWDD